MDQKKEKLGGGRLPTEYVNSVFTMEQQQHQNIGSSFEGSNRPVTVTTNEQILLKQITNTQPNQQANKIIVTPNVLDVVQQRDKDSLSSCQCIANKFGMDAERLSKFYSIFLALFATIALTCSIFLVQLSRSLNASDMATIKFGTQLIFCLPFAYFYRQNVFGPRGARVWLVLRGLVGAFSILAAYFSIKMINFGESMAIRYSSPILTALFARILLKQKLKPVRIILIS
jgi:uncharacterized membrane protein